MKRALQGEERDYQDSLSLNAIGTVIAIHSIQITLTVAFGAALWSTRIDRITIDGTGAPPRHEIVQDNSSCFLGWKIGCYALLSVPSLIAFFVIPRMQVDGIGKVRMNRIHRFDGSTNVLSALMLTGWVPLVPLFCVLAWCGFFPGQTRGEKIIDAKDYTFQNDGALGILYSHRVRFVAAAGKPNGEAELHITLRDSLAKSWELGNVQGFVGGLGSEKKMDPQPRQLRSDPTSPIHAFALLGLIDGETYTFTLKLKPMKTDANRGTTKELLSTDENAIRFEIQQ